MPTTTAAAESICREYADEFPTPNVLRGIALAEAGTITWVALAGVFHRATADALAAVA